MTSFVVETNVHRNAFQKVVRIIKPIVSLPSDWEEMTDEDKFHWLTAYGHITSCEEGPNEVDDDAEEHVVSISPEQSEEVESLQESLLHAIRVLNGILEDVARGDYTPEMAARDYENLTMNEGLDYMSAIQDVAEANNG